MQEGVAQQKTAALRWRAVLKEVALIGAVYLAYSLTRGGLAENAAVAFRNAYDIMHWEKVLGLFVELDIQSFFLQSSFLTQVANSLYTYCYYPALVGFFVWAYVRHREQYSFMRNAFIISAALAFLCFALYPLAPPRFFPHLGFVDTMAVHGLFDYSASSFQVFYNPYAAMPSLHFGWTLMVGIGIIWIAKAWWAKLLGVLLPIATFIGIVATGNHFVLDAVGGALVIGISFGLALLFAKLKNNIKARKEARASLR